MSENKPVQSKVEIPNPRVVSENKRLATLPENIQLCPSCQRPNKSGSTVLKLETNTQAIIAFVAIIGEECVHCGKYMVSIQQSCRKNYRDVMRFALEQASKTDDFIIPWEQGSKE